MSFSQEISQFQIQPAYTKIAHKTVTYTIPSIPINSQFQKHPEEKTTSFHDLIQAKPIQSIKEMSINPAHVQRKTSKRKPMISSQVQKQVRHNFVVKGEFQYKRPTILNNAQSNPNTQSFRTAYAPSQFTLFEEILRMGQEPIEVKFQKVLNIEGEYEICSGLLGDKEVKYCRKSASDTAKMYQEYLIQLN